MKRTSRTRSASMGRPCLKPKDTRLTSISPARWLPPNRRSSSPRRRAVEKVVELTTTSAWSRTGAIMAISRFTASSREPHWSWRGWRRRVSL